MTRDEVQAVIHALADRVKATGEILTNEFDATDKARFTGRHDAFEEATQMLAEALEKSEAGDRGTLVNAAASAGAAVVDAQARLDRTSTKNLSEHARAVEALIVAGCREREAAAALAKVTR